MNIVAIGGGDRTPAIKRSLELSDQPGKVLIVPTAASTERAFTSKVKNTIDFFRDLGIDPTLLHDFGEKPSPTRLTHEIGRTGLIYTIGGNTPHMIRTMQDHGSDTLIKQAIEQGTVHAGTSAGALLPFKLAHSNVAKQPALEKWDYAYLEPGLDIIDAVATAHAEQHDPTPSGPRPDSRIDALMATFPAHINTGFGIENGAAAIFGDNAEIIKARPDAQVHFLQREDANGDLMYRAAEASDLTLSARR